MILTNLCAARLTEYVRFTSAYIHMLVDIFKPERDLRARIQAQQIAIGRGPRQLYNVPISLAYADPAVARHIGLYCFDFTPKSFCRAPVLCYRNVWALLATLRVCPVTSPQSGVTWIELLIIFNLFGGPLDLSQRGLIQCRKPQTAKQELVFFQSVVRAVVKHYVREEDQRLFKAPSAVQKRLLPLGFSTHAAKLAFLPQLTALQQSQVSKALLTLRGRFTLANAAALVEGTLRLDRVSLALRRQPMWMRQLHIDDQISVAFPPFPPSCKMIEPNGELIVLPLRKQQSSLMLFALPAAHAALKGRALMSYPERGTHGLDLCVLISLAARAPQPTCGCALALFLGGPVQRMPAGPPMPKPGCAFRTLQRILRSVD